MRLKLKKYLDTMKKNEKVKTQELPKLGGEQRSLGEAPPSYH